MVAWLLVALFVGLTAGLTLAHAEVAHDCWHEPFVAVIDDGGWFGPL